MGKSWQRSKEQDEYLTSFFDTFLAARQDNRLEKFRSDLTKGWFTKWPEEQYVFPEWKPGDQLTLEETAVLGQAKLKRKAQLYDYIRWHGGGKRVRPTTGTSLLARYKKKETTKPTRKRTLVEIYSDLYYKTKFAEQVRKEFTETSPDFPESKHKRSARKMEIYRRWRDISWAAEDDEVKAHVQQVYDEEYGTNQDNDDGEDVPSTSTLNETDQEIQRRQSCIDVLGEVITAYLRDLNASTNFAFSLFAGGLDSKGEIVMATTHVGKTPSGKSFPNSCDNYDRIMQSFLEFLHIQHPEEERLQQAALYTAPIAPVAVPVEAGSLAALSQAVVTPIDTAPSIPTPVAPSVSPIAPPTITTAAPNIIPPLVAPVALPTITAVAPSASPVAPNIIPPLVAPVAPPTITTVTVAPNIIPPLVAPVAPPTITTVTVAPTIIPPLVTPVAPPTITAVAPSTSPVAPNIIPPSVTPVAPHAITPFAPPSIAPVAPSTSPVAPNIIPPSVTPVAPPSVSPVAPLARTITPFAPPSIAFVAPSSVSPVASPSLAPPVQPVAPYSVAPIHPHFTYSDVPVTTPVAPSFDPMFFSLQPNKVGAGVGISAGQVPLTSADYNTPAWYTQSLQSCYSGTTPSEFDFSGLMNFDTEPTYHNSTFDFTFPISTFPGPTAIAPSPTVTPTFVMTAVTAPKALPTTMETNEQPSTTKKAKKRKTLEDENAHCILPEGSRCERKPRRLFD